MFFKKLKNWLFNKKESVEVLKVDNKSLLNVKNKIPVIIQLKRNKK